MTERLAADSPELFRLLVASVQDYAIFALDIAGNVMTWNAGAQRIKGYRADEIVGRHFSVFYPRADIERRKPHEELEIAAVEGRLEDEGWRLRKDGTPFWASVIITALRDEAGVLQGYAKVTRDLTERRKMEEGERTARKEAERANRLKDEFLATVSHELRTPLNVMTGTLWRLRSGREEEPAVRQRLINTLDRHLRVQTRLVEELLDVSLMLTGRLRLDSRVLELGPILEAAVETVAAAARARSVSVNVEYEGVAGPILGDKDRLLQIFWNLLSNAVKFTPPGGRVDVRLAREGIELLVEVADTGRGIAPAFLDRVFERFSQEDESSTRTHGGLGLGLAVVKHLTEAHGGRVAAHSSGPGHGATFRVYFPVPALTTAIDSLGALAAEPELLPTLRDIRVVVVDDQPDAREAVLAVLSYCGADVRAVATAEEAVRCVESFRPHVLLADIAMPDEDGFALIDKIRHSLAPELRQLPAAALTAYASTASRLRILAAGYQMHIPKPADPVELIAAVAQLATAVGGTGWTRATEPQT